ncbi:hypothetical protein AX17_005850 [Amanita inopinata Kibby_2008]|nr:hypothetical protein AX17_005850 [Amanita inopinata Kibby_2008]
MSHRISPEFAVFASSDFNPSEYANAILAGESYPPPKEARSQSHASTKFGRDPQAKEDVSQAISKLDFNIDDIAKQIKQLVSQHHEDLLSQAANSNELSGSLTSVRANITELDKSLEKLRSKIQHPYHTLRTHVTRLQYLQQASDFLRRTSRFITLARRLQIQMNELDNLLASGQTVKDDSSNKLLNVNREVVDEKDRVLAKAALSLADLTVCLDEPLVQGRSKHMESDESLDVDLEPARDTRLRSVKAVVVYIPFIEESQNRVVRAMEDMLYAGLASRDSATLASSLQISYNLRILPELVQAALFDLTQDIEDHTRSAFDVSRISKDALTKVEATPSGQSSTYKSRIRTEPTNVTAPQWTAILWEKMEGLFEELTSRCIKVYTLENVLILKRDVVTHTLFLDEAMKSLDNKPSSIFWTTLSRSLEKHTRDSVKGSTFLQQTLSTGYPKLLRLFHAFFAKISPHTDTVYTQNHQSPETVLVLNAIANLESLYLSKSSVKMNEAVSQGFSGGSRAPPSVTEGLSIARAISNELDAGKFDPLLVKSLARIVLPTINTMLSRADNLVIRDRSAFSLIGPSATPQQITNAQVTTCLYQCWYRLEKLKDEYSDAVFTVLHPCIKEVHKAYKSLVEPMYTSIRREIGATVSKLHRVDLGKPVNPQSGIGGASFYMRDLAEKLSFIKTEILSRYSLNEAGLVWATEIVKFTVRTFLLHLSIAKPLSESGKLQLTNDMTELEFALSAFLAEGSQGRRSDGLERIGEEYLALRAMRPLLFLDNEQLASTTFTNGLRPLFVLHHILVRSPMPLPHALHGWQEAEYVRWLDEHSEEEAWTLIESGLEHWEKVSESEGIDTKDAKLYADLARKVLSDARESA